MSLAADYEKLRLRDAICGDAKGRAAYLALIEFDLQSLLEIAS